MNAISEEIVEYSKLLMIMIKSEETKKTKKNNLSYTFFSQLIMLSFILVRFRVRNIFIQNTKLSSLNCCASYADHT